jgi:hypothetical protein
MSPENGTPRTFYRVCNWSRDYEISQSRPVKHMYWVARPIRITGSDYAELLDEPEGIAFYGIWHAIIELSANCEPRGSLLKPGGTPHLQKSIARALRISEEILQRSISCFLSLGWLEEVPFTKQSISSLSDNHQHARESLQNGTSEKQISRALARADEQDRTVDKNTPLPPSAEGGGRRPTKREQHALDFEAEQKRRLNLNA